MTNEETIKVLNKINPFTDDSEKIKYFETIELLLEDFQENTKLKTKIEILKNKNLGQSLQLSKWSDEYGDLKTKNKQLKAIIHANEIKTNFNTYCELRECNKKLESEIYQLKSRTCQSCVNKSTCAIFDNFNIDYCSDWEKCGAE